MTIFKFPKADEAPQPQPYVGQVATARTYCNMGQREIYSPTWSPGRPGADDGLRIPSRIGDKRFYRDGRVERIKADAMVPAFYWSDEQAITNQIKSGEV